MGRKYSPLKEPETHKHLPNWLIGKSLRAVTYGGLAPKGAPHHLSQMVWHVTGLIDTHLPMRGVKVGLKSLASGYEFYELAEFILHCIDEGWLVVEDAVEAAVALVGAA